MATFRVVYNEVTKVALIQATGLPVPSGSANAGTFEHRGTDDLGSIENHVLYHHVRDLLYKIGVQDMQSTKIDVSAESRYVPVDAIHATPSTASIAVGATQQLAVEFVPTNATDKTLVYESAKPTIATVSATGLVTGVKKGKTQVAVATKEGNKMDTVTITVT